MARKPKKKPRVSSAAAHTAALRENTLALKRHTELLRAPLAVRTQDGNIPRNDAALVESATFLRTRGLTEPQIKDKLATATSNTVDDLKDQNSVIGMLGGDAGVADIFMSKINRAFWPTARAPHLTFDRIKGMKIGELVTLIHQLLQ
jgi:hypothetical protein